MAKHKNIQMVSPAVTKSIKKLFTMTPTKRAPLGKVVFPKKKKKK